MGPLVNKRHRKRGNDKADANAPPKVLRKDLAAFSPTQSTLRGKSLASMRLEAGSTFFTTTTQENLADAKSMSNPDPLSYAKPQPHPERDVAQSSRKTATEIPTENVATTEVQGQIFAKSPESGKSTSFLSVNGSPGELRGPALRQVEHEERPTRLKSELTTRIGRIQASVTPGHQVSNTQLSQQVSNLQAQVTGEEKIKTTFEEFKKYEDDKADRDLAAVEAYDPEADSKYVKALQDLKDLKYPLVDQLEGLKDALMELIVASLHLEFPG
ncbi:hypothetical protein Tco_1053580 [Tanacetum coccineum]|uniref:Uncharacterized protein n=1 Tax=Tanacetum coccineum TaxID=301880 RepID=A0ABQ5GWS2_9ASTR